MLMETGSDFIHDKKHRFMRLNHWTLNTANTMHCTIHNNMFNDLKLLNFIHDKKDTEHRKHNALLIT